jgi:hypothetical protein
LIYTFAQQPEDEFFTYDNYGSLKIDYPSNWSYIESYPLWDSILLNFFPQDEYNKTKYDVYMRYYESRDGLGGNFPQNPKLENIVKFIDNPANNFTLNTTRIDNSENITIINNDDKKVKTVKEILVNDNLNRKTIRFITVEDVHPIIIVFSAPLNEFDKYQQMFNKMINSMKLY